MLPAKGAHIDEEALQVLPRSSVFNASKRTSCFQLSVLLTDYLAYPYAAVPQIVFLATFLLLLSFWVDLCHQSRMEEEDEEEADSVEDGLGGTSESDSGHSGAFFSRQRWRLWWKKLRPRGRKSVFVGVSSYVAQCPAAEHLSVC